LENYVDFSQGMDNFVKNCNLGLVARIARIVARVCDFDCASFVYLPGKPQISTMQCNFFKGIKN
jgi:hypothetical protein